MPRSLRRRRGGSAAPAAGIAVAIALAALAGPGAASARGPAQTAPGDPAVAAADTAGAATEAYGLYAVRGGETLWRIAAGYGMRAGDLAALNGFRPTAILLPGRTIRVPVVRAANARAGAPAGAPGASGARTLLASVGGAGDAGAADGAATPYEVVAGDTLYGLADRFGVDIEVIKRRNGLPADGSIFAGQTLQIPSAAAGTAIARADQAEAPAAAAPSHDALVTTDTITVAAGDTLGAIAERQGTTAAALIRLNGLDGDAIYEGQTLQVPRQGTGVIGAGGAKRIEVDISEQRMYVFEGGNLAFNWTASTGVASHPTRTGSFAVQSKVPNAWSSAWQLWMPNWLGIYWAGGSENGIHALPIINGTTLWGGLLGSPASYGCVVLETADAATLYDWADIGTPVEIHD